MGGTSLLFALLVSLPALSLCDPLYTLTAPNVLRIESEETVIVEAHNVNTDIDVDIHLMTFPERQVSLCQTKTRLTSANNYLASATVKIPANKLPKESRRGQFVILEAKSGLFNLQSIILITRQTGHIFIQTDKPIYTPTQTVLYRLLTVDSELKPSRNPTVVEFVNPQDIVVERTEVIIKDSTGITGSTYKIPEVVNIGTWKIFASYKDAPDANFTTQFEVKEYVLPSFEVTLDSQKQFFYIDDTELHVTISARFTYGKEVEGRAFVLFGILKNGEKLSIAKSLQTVPIINGHGEAVLEKDHLIGSFEDINSLVGSSIYVTASVITHTGSDLVEAEKTGIKIVVSPYTILFTKTSKYYKPGMPFDMMVYVTNPDGSPASGVPVKYDNADVKSKTHADGIAKLTINTPGEPRNFHIRVSTEVPNTPRQRQASAMMTAEPYMTQGGSSNYLHIGISQTDLSPGEDLLVNLNPRNDNAQVREKIKYFTYMLINKGRIVRFGRQERTQNQVMVTMQIPINPNLIPSFRLLVYYYIEKGSQVEVVADSVWIDVKDTCMGTLKVSAANPIDDKKLYKPGSGFKLKLRGDPGARVGLVAVDKAVFALSKKNKITQSKIWSVVEKSDIGCTPGGGRNFLGVFSDAGLAFATSTDVKTETRAELKCQQPKKRKRRAANLGEAKEEKLRKFTDKLLRQCCEAGMKENFMRFSCSKRQRRITLGKPCADAFRECCEHVHQFKKKLLESMMSLARSADDEYYTPYEDITARSNFPESWLWQMYTFPQKLDSNGHASMEIAQYLKDSITTWEIQAVSVSPKEGVCIAQPYELTVMKNFFIDLRIPYSVVRNEQVEIRAILYNYHDDEIKVRVEFPYNENLCSNAKPTRRYFVSVTIPAKSSTAVPYVIVPLTVGEIAIEVKASVLNVFVTDGVRKSLRVVPEGVKVELPVDTHNLEPKGKVQKFDVSIEAPDDMVPNTEPLTFISAQGNLLAETIENVIEASNLKHLIRVPTGCGEQNLASMTPVLIVTTYLDRTNQWTKLGVNLRETAVKNIQQGYVQELAYRKEDGSFAAFLSRPSSTWLTAYVVKVFAMAHNLITVDANVLCGAVKWLILNKQKPDGYFKEEYGVIHGEMIGGIRQSEGDVPLTAFVLIALIEAKSYCSHYVTSYENSINKASDYLERHIDGLERSYGAVLSAYALSLLGINKEDVVMKFASPDKSYWPVAGNANSLYTIEATGYALLFFLQQERYEQAGKLVRWLSKRSEYGGGYSSTQATIVALQALARYMIDVPEYKEVDLDVELSIPSRSRSIPWKFDTGNAYVTRSLKLNSFERFSVLASGRGQGTLKVFTTYYALLPKERKECKNFNLEVTVEEVEEAKRPEGALNTLLINICARYQSNTESSMVILDISMLTGFSPDTNDLGQLKNGIEDYISRFELDKALSTRGSLIIYLDSVSNLEDTCIAFKVHQFYKVGFIQPASVKIYEYYDTTKSCTRFYNVPGNSGMLSKICQGDVCKCAEGSCVSVKTKRENPAKREEMSCAPGTDYVYKVTFLEKEQRDNYIFYKMEIQTLIKQGSDPVAERETRRLITHLNCDETFHVELNQNYLIMGQSQDLWLDEGRVNYLVGEHTWVERWPTEVECQEEKYRQLCEDLVMFSENLQFHGCGN
ncbi:complement C3-like [Pristis pectinata]|uniref:complement C3-like n=1 Tax=Pristis pectinata TaxID=685728 RepID=UPI00223D8309|nr:complement C3-like [Pristis pectinata]